MKVSFTNFRSFEGGPHVYEFREGTTFVIGDNRDEGFDSNGSGKTTLAALLPWVLYGQLATGADKDDVISYGARECCVELFLPTAHIRRVKSRKHPESLEFWTDDIGGWVKGDLPDVQARLIKWLGVSRRTFFNSYWIDRESKTVQFLYAKPSERQKILEELIDQEYFAEAKIRTTKMRNAQEALLTEIRGRINTLNAKKEGLVREKATAEQDLLRIQERAKAAVEAHAEKLEKQRAAIEALKKRILSAQTELDRQRLANLATPSESLRRKIYDLTAQVAVKEKIAYQEDKIKTCDRCGQTLPRDNYEKVRKEKIEALKFLTDSKAEISRLKESLAEAVLSETKTLTLESDIHSNKLRLRDMNARRLELEAETPTPSEDIEIIENRINELSKKIIDISNKSLIEEISRGEVEQSIPNYRFFEEAFGSQGIPNLLLDDIRSLMSQFTQQYTEGLAKGQITVNYPARDKGFEIEVTYKGQVSDISNFSRGETWRACLSVLLALRRTIAFLHKCDLDFLVMDDPFGDLDESGELAVVDLANHLASEVKHVIVTAPRHVAGVKATQITRVEKKGGVSSLV